VVQVVQAFRQAHALDAPPWPAWEGLLLLVDDAYQALAAAVARKQARRQAAASAAAQRRAAMSGLDRPYASVVQAARIAFLKKQLSQVREGGRGGGRQRQAGRHPRSAPCSGRTGSRAAAQQHRAQEVLRHLAQKNYHLINQLDE
jgi:hypothetical protein